MKFTTSAIAFFLAASASAFAPRDASLNKNIASSMSSSSMQMA